MPSTTVEGMAPGWAMARRCASGTKIWHMRSVQRTRRRRRLVQAVSHLGLRGGSGVAAYACMQILLLRGVAPLCAAPVPSEHCECSQAALCCEGIAAAAACDEKRGSAGRVAGAKRCPAEDKWTAGDEASPEDAASQQHAAAIEHARPPVTGLAAW
jgi:hypothetical protein